MASQGRLLFPAISAICLALFAGWRGLAPRLDPRLLLGVVGAPLLALVLLMPWRYIGPAYAVPPKLPAGTLADRFAGQSIDVSFADELVLVAIRFGDDRIVA